MKGTLRLKANGHWIRMPMVNTRGNLTSHTKILERILNQGTSRFLAEGGAEVPPLASPRGGGGGILKSRRGIPIFYK